MTGAPGRVLVVLHEGVLGGATLSVVRALPFLEREGWRFSFWVAEPSPLATELRERGLDVNGAPRPVAYSIGAMRLPPGIARRLASTPRYLTAFRRHLHDLRPDVVHANSLFTLAEALVARATGPATLLHVHEMLPAGRKGEIASRLAGSRLDEVVAVSKSCGRALGAGRLLPRIVHEAAPIPDEPLRRSRRPGEFRVGMVGAVSTRKGSDLFVAAAESLVGGEGGVEFVMIGSPTDPLDREWASRVLDRARRAGVSHHERADVFVALQGWDVFVMPSRRDPFPISLLEAMGAGLPVVGTAVDGIAEMIAPGTGTLVEPNDASALATAIEALRADPVGAARMGDAARARVIEHFGLEGQARGIDAAYRAALRARERRTRIGSRRRWVTAAR